MVGVVRMFRVVEVVTMVWVVRMVRVWGVVSMVGVFWMVWEDPDLELQTAEDEASLVSMI